MKRLHDTEFEVMMGLWRNETPISTSALRDHLEKERPWNLSPLQTVLSRLEAKGLVRSEIKKHNRYFVPLITEKEYLESESKTFFGRFGGKGLTDLVAGMYDSESITKDDLKELMEYIRSKTDEDNL